MGAVLVGSHFCHHQWLVQVPVKTEPRLTGYKSIAVTTEPRILPVLSTVYKTGSGWWAYLMLWCYQVITHYQQAADYYQGEESKRSDISLFCAVYIAAVLHSTVSVFAYNKITNYRIHFCNVFLMFRYVDTVSKNYTAASPRAWFSSPTETLWDQTLPEVKTRGGIGQTKWIDGAWTLKRVDAKGNNAPYPSWVMVDVEKIKPSVILLVGIRNGIWPIELHTKTPW